MLEEFFKKNKKSGESNKYFNDFTAKGEFAISNNDSLKSLFSQLAGLTFDNGILRIHSLGSSYVWTEYITYYFEEYKNKVYSFAFDWLGRQFSVDLFNKDLIYMFDPATGESFKLEQNIFGFFNEDLSIYKEGTLITDEFYQLSNLHLNNLDFNQCIGYKKILFLGGEDNISNLELIDMEVYWEINRQVFRKIKGLPEGMKINKISFKDTRYS